MRDAIGASSFRLRLALAALVAMAAFASLAWSAKPGNASHANEASAGAVPLGVAYATLHSNADSWIDEYYPLALHGSESSLVISWNSTVQTQACTLLRFDVSSIPADATILDASLSMYQTGATGEESSVILSVFRLGDAWIESSVDWDTRPPVGALLAWADSTQYTAIKTWSGLASEVQSWLSGTNYGIEICGPAGPGQAAYSRTFSSDESGGWRPELNLQYDDPHLTLTATRTTTGTATSTATPTATNTSTVTPTLTSTSTVTPTATNTGTATPTATAVYHWHAYDYLPLVLKP